MIITGPTAIGKTALGIRLATQLQGEILSVDSRQVYRYMDIGTAKPSPHELSQVKHHFIDIKNPDERYSAGQFGQEARALIQRLAERETVPVLVGGSGLYLQAILDGFFEEERDYSRLRPWLQKRLEQEGLQKLYEELGRLDPIAQSRLAAHDTQRILRALELAHGGDRAEAPSGRALDCSPLAFCLTMRRERLYQRIEQRVDEMVQRGFREEVERLAAQGYGRESWAMRSLGYEEMLDYLGGKCRWEEALAAIKLRSRQYAKRQLTWFRKDRRLRWLDLEVWGVNGVAARIAEHFNRRAGFYH